MIQIRSFVAGCAALLLTSGALAADKPPFPRLAGVNIGGPHNYDDLAYQAKLAKLDFAVLNYWPGWSNTRDMTMEQVVRNIKARNPNAKIFLYQMSMEGDDYNASFAPIKAKIDQMRWWAYPTGSSGSRILSTYGVAMDKAIHVINTTLHTPRDSSGYQYWEWHARWVVQNIAKPNPSIAGVFEDAVSWKPRTDADWNRDGVSDSQDGANAGKWLREGYRQRFALLHQLMPGKYVIGNVADWGAKEAVLTELDQTLHGGVIEGILGTRYAPEKWASWSEMMRWYRKTMAAIAEPKLVAFNQHGATTDYQALRYGLASCLLDNGYFSFTNSAGNYSGVVWFDEYDAKLGQATQAPTTTAWQNGVYRRNFENGIALVNPRGNGPREVTLEEDFKRLSGKQAPGVNNGQLTRKVQLNDRDGIILMRVKPTPLPSAPQLVGVR
jgi:Hypothetical glycosyl hydrolase family 15